MVDYMPAELIEQILLNLPVKSLLRFSTSSKLWNSIIFGPEFAQSYRGREMIVFRSLPRHYGVCANTSGLALPLSSISSDNPADETTPFVFPPGSYLSSCDSLWCLEFKKSLILYNPSIRTYRKLPNPPLNRRYITDAYVYGLGYDSECDDYKILRIPRSNYYSKIATEMYSLRSDCWRIIEPHSLKGSYLLSNEGFFVSGALHWLVAPILLYDDYGVKGNYNNLILSFDLSQGKFRSIALPEEVALPKPISKFQHLEMIVFGGKLRVYSCYDYSHISVWVMRDYESKLWMKEMEFDYGHMFSRRYSRLRPFYFYDGLGNVVRALALNDTLEKMFIYKEEKSSPTTPTLLEKNFGSDIVSHLGNSFTYVESLICFPEEDDEWIEVDDVESMIDN